MKPARIDVGTVVAVTWVAVAVGLTVVFGPRLGLRGLAWLLAHHLLCAVGAGYELRRGWRRRRSVRARAPQEEPPT